MTSHITSKKWFPKERIDKKAHADHDQNLIRLGIYRRSFAAQSKLWIDVAILDRLFYKNNNQHRHFHRFRRTAEARRLLKRFKRLALDHMMNDLYACFWNGNDSHSHQQQRSWLSIPCRELCEFTMQKLISAVVILDKLQVVLVEIYREYTTLFRLQHFMSMAMVHMGICARLGTLAHKWAAELDDCYTVLQQWHLAFPVASKRANRYECLPDTMTRQRQIASKWSENRVSFKKPVHFESYLTHGASETAAKPSTPSLPPSDSPMNFFSMAEKDNDDLGEVLKSIEPAMN
ncbi:hypothetical protein DM01DRAFT_1309412 [Hesseltinella vesiculosa]|uniref:Nucleolus and neural progenitor protein-like N-terminal domain-containing protein n=1 Tax=Hesseltinella vesiculosa TaxID=101127 RepID=A0A1X2GA67_9FUNG|nr:hypothetical protein DM01DRAFT_1309412 [Hesseltinella vesiculosa]